MLMSEGAWLTISVSIAGAFGSIIAAIWKSAPNKSNGNGDRTCPAHSGVNTEINSIKSSLEKQDKTLGELRKDLQDDVRGIYTEIGRIRTTVQDSYDKILDLHNMRK